MVAGMVAEMVAGMVAGGVAGMVAGMAAETVAGTVAATISGTVSWNGCWNGAGTVAGTVDCFSLHRLALRMVRCTAALNILVLVAFLAAARAMRRPCTIVAVTATPKGH